MRTIKSKPKNIPPRSGHPPQPRILNNLMGVAVLILLWVVPLAGQMEFRGPVASLFTDERLYKAGDVITVVISERISGVNRQQSRSQRGTETEVEFGAGPSKVFGLLNPFSGQVSAQNNFDSRIQNNKLSTFATDVSVRVARTDELGNLFLEGSKVVDLPDEKLVVFLSGPQPGCHSAEYHPFFAIGQPPGNHEKQGRGRGCPPSEYFQPDIRLVLLNREAHHITSGKKSYGC